MPAIFYRVKDTEQLFNYRRGTKAVNRNFYRGKTLVFKIPRFSL